MRFEIRFEILLEIFFEIRLAVRLATRFEIRLATRFAILAFWRALGPGALASTIRPRDAPWVVVDSSECGVSPAGVGTIVTGAALACTVAKASATKVAIVNKRITGLGFLG